MSIGETIQRPAVEARAADPITTEVVRNGLNAAAEQIKRTLVRTAFSPVIYEVLDFAVALYDRKVRMLAQAPSLPLFMGTMSFCVEAAVAGAGGEDALEPGDVILFNDPYGTGSHPQDVAIVMPVFWEERELIGYSAVKAHWLDIGGKDVYSTDTTDVFQEGTIFPGVKLYSRGKLVRDIRNMALANSRVPKMVAGDIDAEVTAVRAGERALVRLVARHGLETFRDCVERMFDHGEALVRSYFERIPDGRYVGRAQIDSDGLGSPPVPFEVVVEIDGSAVTLDFRGAPEMLPGPFNCPLASTYSASRVAISTLAGAGEAPNEGHFRALKLLTRPGSIFEPSSPAPCFLYAWPAVHAIDAIYRAVADAIPDTVPADSGGDLCVLCWWGHREETGEPWADGSPHPVGQGAHRGGDGAHALMHISEAAARLTPTEVAETKNPWLLERVEFATDSGGAGEHAGGLGLDIHYRMLEESFVTSVVDNTTVAPRGSAGGGSARANETIVRSPEGQRRSCSQATGLRMPPGSVLELETGGGGGHGPASQRPPEQVHADLADGYISEAFARRHYPHAFDAGERSE